MRINLVAFLVLTTFFSVYAQPTSTVNEAMMIEIGDEKLAESDYYNALDWYNRAYKEQKKKDNNLRFKIAHLHYTLRDFVKAEKWFARCVKSDKKGKMPQAVYYLGMAQKMNGSYPDAINTFDSYLSVAVSDSIKSVAQREMDGAKMAMAMRQNDAITVENAGKTVNSKFSEFSPKYVGDALYYGALKAKKAILLDGKEGEYHAKIYKASGQDDKNGFAEAVALDESVNRAGFHTGNECFSRDGSKMFFTRSSLAGNIVGVSEIYMAEKSGDSFAKATLVTGPNGDWIAKQPATGELYGKEVLFFVSDMPGGKGGDDIYYCTSNGDGTYGMPVNLGDAINTPFNEETPFFRDGKFWFSSNGHLSMGGLDIYSTTWNGSNWSKLENLGPGYNSSVDDFGFFVNESGYKGALVSNRPSVNSLKSKTCCDDIFLVAIEPVIIDVNALVFDTKKKALPGATMQLFTMNGEKIGDTDSKANAAANNFNFALAQEKAYMMIVNVPGYYPDTIRFNTVGISKSQTLTKKLYLKPKEPEMDTVYINEPIRLNNIYYDFDDAKILSDAEADLYVLLGLLEKYPDMVIELSSHTDSRGPSSYNQRLSQRRADSAKKWLVAKGVTDERVKPVGYGETQILNHCTNGAKCEDEEHRYNRRTEFKIIAGPTSIKIPRIIRRGETGSVTPKSTEKKKVINIADAVRLSSGGTSLPKKGAVAVKNTKKPAPQKMVRRKVTKASAAKTGLHKVAKGAQITLEEPKYNFGTIKEGVIIKRDFRFTNTGDEDLLIEIATGSCGCTVPEWPTLPIKPGQSDVIHVTFDSTDKEYDTRVEVNIVANTEPIVTEIILTGKVIPKRDFKKE